MRIVWVEGLDEAKLTSKVPAEPQSEEVVKLCETGRKR